MTETNEEEEKTIEMMVLTVVCEIEPVNGDVEHVWALPLHRRYMVPKVSAKEREEATKDIRVSPGNVAISEKHRTRDTDGNR